MTEMNRRYDTVIFDLDGTLLDTLTDLADSLNVVLERYHMPKRSTDEVRRFVGNGIRKLICRSIPDGDENPDFDRIFEGFREYYGSHCMDATKPYPGIIALLEWMKQEGFRVAVVSNKADFAVKKLCSFYFGDLVGVAIGERSGCRRKPAPDSVLQALTELGADSSRAVYIGDSDVDILTAANAGLDYIAVSWGFRSRSFLLEHGAAPERIAEDVNELKSFMDLELSSVQRAI